MAFIIILLVISAGFCIFSYSGAPKKGLEIFSAIIRLCVCGFFAMIFFNILNIQFKNQWMQLLFLGIGAAVVWGLITGLSQSFRLIGYSINYFINSFAILFIALMLGKNASISFIAYIVALLLFPRIMWISDRKATSEEYSHRKTSFMGDVETTYYTKKAVDKWEDSADSWRHIPVQIAVSALFYALGSITILAKFNIGAFWMQALYLIAAVAVNVVLDLFVFRWIEKRLFD